MISWSTKVTNITKGFSYTPGQAMWDVEGKPTSLVNWKGHASMAGCFASYGKFFVYEAPSSENVLRNELST
jgi:hypothetical protein